MTRTQVTQHIDAPRPLVYRALLDAGAVAAWTKARFAGQPQTSGCARKSF
jgi:hypothetical protein